jgi:hypothetical protein
VLGGSRTVCVYAINTLSGRTNPRLGCRTVTVPATTFLPIGNIDGATVSGTTVTVNGWALDKDVPTDPVRVHLSVDGAVKTATTADRPRADIGAAFPGAGVNHGWQVAMTLSPGVHEICAFGINLAGGSSNPQLACRTVTVP